MGRKNNSKDLDSKISIFKLIGVDKDTISMQTPSVLSIDMEVKGDISSKGFVDIGGKVDGSVSGQYITLKKTSRVSGRVHAKCVLIHGNLEGDVVAEQIVVSSTGTCKGNVIYDRLSIEEGGEVVGNITKSKDQHEYALQNEETVAMEALEVHNVVDLSS